MLRGVFRTRHGGRRTASGWSATDRNCVRSSYGERRTRTGWAESARHAPPRRTQQQRQESERPTSLLYAYVGRNGGWPTRPLAALPDPPVTTPIRGARGSAMADSAGRGGEGGRDRDRARQGRMVLLFLHQLRSVSLCLGLCIMLLEHSDQLLRWGHVRRSMGFNRAAAMLMAWICLRPRPPRWWVRPRTGTSWWQDEVLQRWDDERWLYHFRMTKATLFEIADTLRPHLQRSEDATRAPVGVEERVAITIWWLSSPLLYRKTAATFGIGITTVAEIVIEVCIAMEAYLLPATVNLDDPRKIMDGFLAMGFPQCIGAIDGTHIHIRAPKGREAEFINRKQRFSIQLQGTVDHTGRFIDIECGFSGRHHDAHVFRSSAIFSAMEAGVYVPGNPTIEINGVRVGPVIIADAAYPLSRWLMKPYVGQLDARKQTFNRVLTKCRNVVERAFGRLKSRWRCLTAPLPLAQKNINSVAVACVVLHNICETRGHVLHPDLPPVEPPPVPLAPLDMDRRGGRRLREGERVRAAIAATLAGE